MTIASSCIDGICSDGSQDTFFSLVWHGQQGRWNFGSTPCGMGALFGLNFHGFVGRISPISGIQNQRPALDQ